LLILSCSPTSPEGIHFDFEDGPQGWIVGPDKTEKAAVRTEQVLDGQHQGRAALGVWFQLNPNQRDGAVLVMAPGNYAGRTITAWVYCPVGIAGPRNAPSGIRLAVQDRHWRSQYSKWYNIGTDPVWHDVLVNRWRQITITPSRTPPEGYYTPT